MRTKNARPATRALRESEDTASATRLVTREMSRDCAITAGPSQASSHFRNCSGASDTATMYSSRPGRRVTERFSAISTPSLPRT